MALHKIKARTDLQHTTGMKREKNTDTIYTKKALHGIKVTNPAKNIDIKETLTENIISASRNPDIQSDSTFHFITEPTHLPSPISSFHAKADPTTKIQSSNTDSFQDIKPSNSDSFQGIKPSNPDSFYAIKSDSSSKSETKSSNQDTDSFHDIKTQLDATFPDITSNGETSHVKKRQKRFLPFFKKSEATESDNFFFKILEFLNKNRRSVIPVFTVMREINTLVKSVNGELNHSSKERNNYIGHNPPVLPLVTYNLELGSDSRAKAFVKRLLGLKVEGDRLTIAGK